MKHSKNILHCAIGLSVFLLFLYFPQQVWAQEYVLPYPGFMPGHPLYKVSELVDKFQEWWSFGSFTKFKHHLSLTDKKLIEAKTLFEYKQYLLGYVALKISDNHFQDTIVVLETAEKENKNISQKKEVFRTAAAKHIEVLNFIGAKLPENFIWQPENATETQLRLREIIDEAIRQRKEAL